MMRFVTMIAIVTTSCGGNSEIVIENNTSVEIDTGVIRAMVYRMCPTCDGKLKIEIYPESSRQEVMKCGRRGEFNFGPFRTDTIRLLVNNEGYCVTEQLHALSHELVHWRLKHLTGDTNSAHDAIDWYLKDALNEEFSCQDSAR